MIQFIIELPDINSIKDKRRIINSIKSKLQQRFKLSVAEVDLQDSWCFAQIGAAIVSNSKQFGESVLHKAFRFIEGNMQGRLIDVKIISEFF